MDIGYRIDNDILYISVAGRIDSHNASDAEEKIFSMKNGNPRKHVVLDADKLEYISSAGLRVILRLRKEEPKVAIINTAPDVYDVLEMTGFTDMITVEKAYRRIDIEGCEFVAKGANGAVYRYDDETIVKVYFSKDALPEIKRERENARRAFVLGVNTAIPYGIVRVGEGYGTVTELLNAVSVTKLIRNNPDDFSEATRYYIDMLKSIHAIKVDGGEFPDMRETALEWADFVAPHLPEEDSRKLRALIEAIPVQNTLMHGDYHTSNIMVQNGAPLLIDMDTLCTGHPIFEFGSMFYAFIGYSELDPQNTKDFFGYSFETAVRFWNAAVKMYLGTDDESLCQSLADKAMIVGYTRLLRRTLRRSNKADSPMKIARCKEMLNTLLDRVDTLVF